MEGVVTRSLEAQHAGPRNRKAEHPTPEFMSFILTGF